MTILQALGKLDSLKHNTYSQLDKIGWLSELDGRIQSQILDALEGETLPFSGYDADTALSTVLLAQAPFDAIYLPWLEAKVDYYNGETGLYNDAITLFNNLWTEFENHCRRTRMPKGTRLTYR